MTENLDKSKDRILLYYKMRELLLAYYVILFLACTYC